MSAYSLERLLLSDEYMPTNREKSKAAKREMFYCPVCDRDSVGQHGKCGHCGQKIRSNKLKGFQP